jgi:hypothetical protein
VSLILFMILAGLALILYYLAACRWRPLVDCWCCHGSGRHSKGKFFRRCWICRGEGSRFRMGRKIWNHFRSLRDKAVG